MESCNWRVNSDQHLHRDIHCEPFLSRHQSLGVLHHHVVAVLKRIAQLDQPANHGAHHRHLDPGLAGLPPREPRRPVRRAGQLL